MSLIPFGRFRFKKFDLVFVHILMVSASVRNFTANVYEPKAQSDKTEDYLKLKLNILFLTFYDLTSC